MVIGLVLEFAGANIAYEQKGLSSFSNIHFFNKLLYFYQADELWIPFQLIGKYRCKPFPLFTRKMTSGANGWKKNQAEKLKKHIIFNHLNNNIKKNVSQNSLILNS